jgi:hypothetical protein
LCPADAGGGGFGSIPPVCLKERTEVVVSDSCFQVSMEMIVMGKYVRSEGRYRKAFV